MGHDLVERFAEELQNLSPFERRAALSELEALLHTNGIEASLRRRSTTALVIGAVLAVVVVRVVANRATFGGISAPTTGVSCSRWIERPPLGPVAADRAGGGCNCATHAAAEPSNVAITTSTSVDDTLQLLAHPDGRATQPKLPPWTIGYPWHRLPRSSYPAHGAFDHPQDALRKARKGSWNTSDFPLYLCVGQGKTATKSLNKAFVMLGMNTAHFYGAGVYGLLYDNAAEQQNHHFMFNVNEEKHVEAVLDTPVVDFWNEILLSYPRAKVILTIRNPKSWLRSQQKFYSGFARGCRKWLEPWRRGSNLVYGTECPSKEQAIKRYVQHNRNVFDSVPPERLLIMDMTGGDGWDKLCPFMGLDPPVCPPTNITQCLKAGVSSCAFPNRK